MLNTRCTNDNGSLYLNNNINGNAGMHGNHNDNSSCDGIQQGRSARIAWRKESKRHPR